MDKTKNSSSVQTRMAAHSQLFSFVKEFVSEIRIARSKEYLEKHTERNKIQNEQYYNEDIDSLYKRRVHVLSLVHAVLKQTMISCCRLPVAQCGDV